MRPLRIVGRLGPTAPGLVAGTAVGLSFPGLALAVNDVVGVVVVLSLFIGSPVLLLAGLILGAAGHRSWLFGLAAGAGGLFWLWALYVHVGPGR